MGPLGWQETLVIFVLVLLLFGPKKLPEVGKNIAKAINEFRKASNELKDTWHREMANLEKETQDIKKEAESLSQTTAEIANDTSYYNYDSSYDYGAYGYPESTEGSGSTTTTESSSVSASATQGADSTGSAAAEHTEAVPTLAPAEGAVHTASPVTPSNAAGAADPAAHTVKQ